ncbi:MAG: hypothetical protein Sapg2KO_34570 [Saprospiraceae bacterium]
MFFLNPTYLWALLGLIVPIAIHLWSKKEGQTIKIGSIQLLDKADTTQSRSIKLNEFWLLVMRLLIISVLVLILSNLHLKKNLKNAPITYVVESSLLQNKEFRTILGTTAKHVPIRLLQKGFPEISIDANPALNPKVPNYWQLAKEMQSLPSDSLVVFTKAYQTGFKGIRPLIYKPIEWVTINEDKNNQHLLDAHQFEEQVELLLMNSSNQQVSFDKEILPANHPKIKWNTSKDSIYYLKQWAAVKPQKTHQVLLFYDADYLAEINYLEAGFNVVSEYLKQEIKLVKTNELEQIDDQAFDIVIWLSKKPVLDTDGKVVRFRSDPSAAELIEESLTQDTYYLTRPLNVENIETDHLPEQLIQLLDLNQGIEQKIKQYDTRILANEAFIPGNSKPKLGPANNYSLDMTNWLWTLFILLLVSERILSYYRSQ